MKFLLIPIIFIFSFLVQAEMPTNFRMHCEMTKDTSLNQFGGEWFAETDAKGNLISAKFQGEVLKSGENASPHSTSIETKDGFAIFYPAGTLYSHDVTYILIRETNNENQMTFIANLTQDVLAQYSSEMIYEGVLYKSTCR